MTDLSSRLHLPLVEETLAEETYRRAARDQGFRRIVVTSYDHRCALCGTSATKLIGTDSLMEFGQKIVRLHKPGSINYAAKFGIRMQPEAVELATAVQESPALQYIGGAACQECGVEVDKKVAYFCRLKKDKFNGKILCRECQQIPEI